MIWNSVELYLTCAVSDWGMRVGGGGGGTLEEDGWEFVGC